MGDMEIVFARSAHIANSHWTSYLPKNLLHGRRVKSFVCPEDGADFCKCSCSNLYTGFTYTAEVFRIFLFKYSGLYLYMVQ